MRFVVFAAIILIAGCSSAGLEPLALLRKETKAEFMRAHGTERRMVGPVSVEGLPGILARAWWVDRRLNDKDGYWLGFGNGSMVFLATDPDAFEVAGVSGCFNIRKSDRKAYRVLFERIRAEAGQLPEAGGPAPDDDKPGQGG